MESQILTKIKELELELKTTDYNKSTEHHIGKLKAKLARLYEELHKCKSKKHKIKGIKKSGDATIGLIGFPSVGKSTLLNALTNAKSPIGDYDFTTWKIIPGMMHYQGANIQIYDMPGLIEDCSKGRGGGKQILSTIRVCDLLLIMLSAPNALQQLEIIKKELYDAGIRINTKPPNISIKKRSKGGIIIFASTKPKISEATIKNILTEFGYCNCEITIRDEIDEMQLIDFLLANRVYIPTIIVINKIDLVNQIPKLYENYITISATKQINLDELKKKIYLELNFIKIYLNTKDEKNSLIISSPTTIKDVCARIHSDFIKKFKYGIVSGKSVKYSGMRVGLEHYLANEDVVKLIIK